MHLHTPSAIDGLRNSCLLANELGITCARATIDDPPRVLAQVREKKKQIGLDANPCLCRHLSPPPPIGIFPTLLRTPRPIRDECCSLR